MTSIDRGAATAWEPSAARVVPPDAAVGESAPWRATLRECELVARSDATVLLTGETGVGKGLLARRIHALSRRSAAPFVHVDCAALSPSLVESELFGHERGAFTGAFERRAGRFDLARDGTLFLDEIGELAPRLQAKLLRVLQDREYERIGGSRTLAMTARVIAATNRDLRREVREGRFRADLYYRLDVFRVEVPPLRERRSDIPALARAALSRLARRHGLAPPELAPELVERLASRTWPGNVRELLNVLERLLVHASGRRAGVRDLERLCGDGASPYGAEPVARAARCPECASAERIASALAASGGNVARAARDLGLPRSTLRHRMRRLGLLERHG